MVARSPLSLKWAAILVLIAGSYITAAGPCDIYEAGDTPCVAAHSSVRALYESYAGPLYQVQRRADNSFRDVSPIVAGGIANAATQDKFCTSTTCVITVIYDQSGRENHLTQAPRGGAATGPQADGHDDLAGALGAPVTLNGSKAYGVFVSPGTGYRNNDVNGSAIGDDAQGIYAVLDGTHYNDACCFDYGNAETNSLDTGNGHMETIYFGTGASFGSTGTGEGPWILADLENGLFSGNLSHGINPGNPTITDRFVTAAVKGQPNRWAIRGSDATSGNLSTFYEGERPTASGYNPMCKEGAIILGIGGDNSNWAQGTFYEGAITSGYPSDDIENQVQADVIAAGYATSTLASGMKILLGLPYLLRVTTPDFDTHFISHDGSVVSTQAFSSIESLEARRRASFKVKAGFANHDCVSFESVTSPGSFLRHMNYQVRLDVDDHSKAFSEDATFCPQDGLNGQGTTFRSWNFPARYLRHYTGNLYIAYNGGPNAFDRSSDFVVDATFEVGGSLV